MAGREAGPSAILRGPLSVVLDTAVKARGTREDKAMPSGRYRITIDGFRCNAETWDDALNWRCGLTGRGLPVDEARSLADQRR